ncbi:hypothetical protein SESBI_49759 [Sesbania bispinosa]|nr:hypothetical protein SESBI_49759 [Sesbania bispinosa]
MAELVLLIWAIWKRRNEFIHKEIQPNPIITIARANSLLGYLNLIEQISCTRGNGARNFHTSKAWRAPREDAIKINRDAAFKPHLRYAAIAAIARNLARTILSVSSKLIPAASALIAEALAVREGCSIVQMVKDIQKSSSLIPNCGFLWTHREGNQLAHSITQATLLTRNGIHFISSIPNRCRDTASLDECTHTQSMGRCSIINGDDERRRFQPFQHPIKWKEGSPKAGEWLENTDDGIARKMRREGKLYRYNTLAVFFPSGARKREKERLSCEKTHLPPPHQFSSSVCEKLGEKITVVFHLSDDSHLRAPSSSHFYPGCAFLKRRRVEEEGALGAILRSCPHLFLR